MKFALHVKDGPLVGLRLILSASWDAPTIVDFVGPTQTRVLNCSWPFEILPLTRYCRFMNSVRVPGGAVHRLPGDLREALLANPVALAAWRDITRLARNEFICWVEDAKQKTTRARRIRRTQEELEEGQRRPCCWPGCAHRERNGR